MKKRAAKRNSNRHSSKVCREKLRDRKIHCQNVFAEIPDYMCSADFSTVDWTTHEIIYNVFHQSTTISMCEHNVFAVFEYHRLEYSSLSSELPSSYSVHCC